jgi:hypothetical protein
MLCSKTRKDGIKIPEPIIKKQSSYFAATVVCMHPWVAGRLELEGQAGVV